MLSLPLSSYQRLIILLVRLLEVLFRFDRIRFDRRRVFALPFRWAHCNDKAESYQYTTSLGPRRTKTKALTFAMLFHELERFHQTISFIHRAANW